MKRRRKDFRKAVKAGEQDALEMLVDFFDWLDSLEPQLKTGVVPLYEDPQMITNGPTQMKRTPAEKAKDPTVSFSLCSHLVLEPYVCRMTCTLSLTSQR